MSYLRRWRKVRSTVTSIALQSSSEDEVDCTSRPCSGGERDKQKAEDSGQRESVMHASDSESDLGSDFGFNENVDSSDEGSVDGDTNINIEDGPTFQEKIAAWCVENHTTRSAVNQLLHILRGEGLPFPKDARTLLQTPRAIATEEKCGGTYAFFGLKSSITKVLSCLNQDNLQIPNQIDLIVNIDGVPLFKSSGSQFWPILCSFREESPFLVALFYGKSKPNSVDEFLHDFLTEYSEIKQSGILYENSLIKVNIKAFVCDAPARSFLKCIKGHTGYYACERCIIKGEWKNNRILMSGMDCAPRTDEMFARNMYGDHQNDISPLLTVGFQCVSRFSLDYMHLVCLGVMKRILTFLKQGPSECKLSHRQISEISGELVSFAGKLPSEFARQPRTLFELERWKATEFRQFLLYTGPIVLKKVLHKNVYNHFLCLTVGISVLLDTSDHKRKAYLNYARQLLKRFVDKSKDIYSEHFQVYNVHSLKHLSDDVDTFQCSLNEISAFPFENHLQIIKRLVRNSKNPIGQVGKRISEFEAVKGQSKTKKYTNLTYISTTKRNGCLLLKNEDFAFVREKRQDGSLVCDVIQQRHLDNFFTEPCESKLINIALMTHTHSSRCRRRLVESDEIYRKVVCLPSGRGHNLLPLLHGMETHKW